MKQINVLKTVGVVTIVTCCIAAVGWAQPKQNRSPGQFTAKRAGVAQQQMAGFPGRGFGGDGIGINWAELDLSEEQKEQIQQKFREFQVNTAEIRQKLQFAQKDLRAEMQKDPVDQAKIGSFWAEITNLKKELGEAQVNHILAIKGILTPEQLEKLQESGKTARELRELRVELQEILLAPGEPDVEQLKQLQAKIAEKEVVLEKERFEKIAEKMASLTPEQRERMQKLRGKRGRMQPPKQQ